VSRIRKVTVLLPPVQCCGWFWVPLRNLDLGRLGRVYCQQPGQVGMHICSGILRGHLQKSALSPREQALGTWSGLQISEGLWEWLFSGPPDQCQDLLGTLCMSTV
jgi:hypothetical protein